MLPKVEEGLRQVLESDPSSNEWIDVVVSFDVQRLGSASLPESGRVANRPLTSAALASDRQARSAVVAKLMRALLESAGDAAGEQPEILSQQPLLGSAVVKAHPRYFRALLDRPGIKGAMLNRSHPTVIGRSAAR